MSKKKKKLKLNYRNIMLTILMGMLVALSITYGYKTIFLTSNETISNIDENKKIKDDVASEENVYKISLIMAGDNLIHSIICQDAQNLAGGSGYDFKPMYEYIKPIVQEYDLAYYNQETILGGIELGLSDYPAFNSPYEVGDAMIDTGFNLVSLATNHTMDKGEQAVLNSRAYWDSHDNVLAVGSYSGHEERNKIQIREINNISYTLLNYTYGTNGMPVPSGKDYLVNVWPTDFDNINDPDKDTKYQEYKNQVKEDIEKVRDKVDVLMVAMHWGVEYTHEPTAYEIDMAEYLSSLDVDIIIGTHPHVIQPITWIDDTLVIYSLGNFMSAQYQNQYTCTNYKCVVGLMSSLDITKIVKGDKSSIKIDNIDNELIYTYYNTNTWKDYKVVPFSSSEIVNYLPNYKNVYNTYKDIVVEYDDNIHVKEVYEG